MLNKIRHGGAFLSAILLGATLYRTNFEEFSWETALAPISLVLIFIGFILSIRNSNKGEK